MEETGETGEINGLVYSSSMYAGLDLTGLMPISGCCRARQSRATCITLGALGVVLIVVQRRVLLVSSGECDRNLRGLLVE